MKLFVRIFEIFMKKGLAIKEGHTLEFSTIGWGGSVKFWGGGF